MTDWDKLEGDELNLPLARFAGWHGEVVWITDEDGDTAYLFPPGVEESADRSHDCDVPVYTRSVDSCIRELVPLLGPDATWQVGREIKNGFAAFVLMDWGRGEGYWTFGVTPGTALARALGKALEVRYD